MKNKNIALITTNQMEAPIRTVGGILEENGMNVYLYNLGTGINTFKDKYPKETKKDLEKLLKEQKIDAVGFSIADIFLERSIDLAKNVKKNLNLPIIFGGVHVQLYPDEILKENSIDGICIREAYDGTNETFEQIGIKDRIKSPNFITKNFDGTLSKGEITLPKTKSEFQNLPMPIASNKKAYLLNEKNGAIENYPENKVVTPEQHQIGHPNTIVYNGTWGCANSCDFCHVNQMVNQAKDDAKKKGKTNFPRVITKPIKRQLQELKKIKEENPAATFINFGDNDFFQKSKEDMEYFAENYPKEIGLPFYCMGSPNTISEEKLELIVNAGLKELNVGIESNEKTNREFYNRNISESKILEMDKTISQYSNNNQIDVFYDFISFNPGETSSNVKETINLIKKLNPNFDQVIHHLTLGKALDTLTVKLSQDLKISPEELIDNQNVLDYHNLPEEYLKKFDKLSGNSLYENLVMEWIAGKHDDCNIGNLPRKTSDFLERPEINKYFSKNEINDLKNNQNTPEETFDALFYEPIKRKLKPSKIAIEITKSLPAIKYTNQLKQGVFEKN